MAQYKAALTYYVLIVWYCTDTTCLLVNQQHMIADTVRMIRHCQSDQPGESSHL